MKTWVIWTASERISVVRAKDPSRARMFGFMKHGEPIQDVFLASSEPGLGDVLTAIIRRTVQRESRR